MTRRPIASSTRPIACPVLLAALAAA
ncbi:MAG: hypothetical protein JWO31_1659, partial [Phycisphaerales bacterium]|nr:hypothetical protein [Phycisphaerales bacterium]